jgi:hypothetical protein
MSYESPDAFRAEKGLIAPTWRGVYIAMQRVKGILFTI